jgi:hypothetical protein
MESATSWLQLGSAGDRDMSPFVSVLLWWFLLFSAVVEAVGVITQVSWIATKGCSVWDFQILGHQSHQHSNMLVVVTKICRPKATELFCSRRPLRYERYVPEGAFSTTQSTVPVCTVGTVLAREGVSPPPPKQFGGGIKCILWLLPSVLLLPAAPSNLQLE